MVEKDKNKIIEMKNNNNSIIIIKEVFVIDSFFLVFIKRMNMIK
jgi:hypothetical protein